MQFDAIVLAGGGARRLGGVAKPQVDVGGVTLLDRVVAAVSGAGTVVVVGPHQPVTGAVQWAREEPPGSGPVAGLVAALPFVSAPVVVTLAADLPWIAPAVPLLLDAVPVDGVAVLVDTDGRRNHLAAAWRTSALRDALTSLGEPRGARVGALLRRAPAVVDVRDLDGAGRDCDTWDDVDAARARQHDLDG